MGDSPRLRPPTLLERNISWMYAMAPTGLAYLGLMALTYLLTRPDMNIFSYFMEPNVSSVAIGDWSVPLNLNMILARSFFLVAYFTWGRSTGHLVIGAHVVDRKTGRRMKTWQKLVRGFAQMGAGSMYIVMDFISLLLILIDREERRSVYDWVAGTMVVVGDLPPEEERQRSWVAELGRVFRRQPAAPESAGS